MWLVVHDNLLTNWKRYSRHLASDPNCARCGASIESALHVLKDCLHAHQIWEKGHTSKFIPDFYHLNLLDWLKHNQCCDLEFFRTSPWPLWEFQHALLSTQALQGRPTREERLVAWLPPPLGWVKVNSDGAYRSSLHRATASRVVRDWVGNWINGFAYNIGICSVISAELWGILQGLQLVWNDGYRNVVVESDSNLAVNALTGKSFGDGMD
ncbi:hypothetical protein K2173_003100 [Erythroxylum novogranatense]|uniref:Uncharacterized protein n=1 Tax=Erythroxylum novogranatense TaxID=1862640 RepID=A0AAV8TBR1_9ROSI|nr:hypothetical protein K2173_003100 [Erythroxylum novogranatense]